MKNINFIEIDKYKTNASVIAFLSQHEYKFEPINFYEEDIGINSGFDPVFKHHARLRGSCAMPIGN